MNVNPLPGSLGENYWYDTEADVLVSREPNDDDAYVLHAAYSLVPYAEAGRDIGVVQRMLAATTPLQEGDIWLIRASVGDPLEPATVKMTTGGLRFDTSDEWMHPDDAYEKRFLMSNPNV